MNKAWKPLLMLLVVLLGLWFVWEWFFCRFYVAPGQMAVIIAKSGQPLPPDQTLAKPGQRGVQEAPLGEGRHFLNPYFYDWEFHPTLTIEPGKVGVVTSKVGATLPQGEFLADPGQMGVWKQVLGPGKYRLNPYGYAVEIVDAVSIPIGYAGVVTNLAGDAGTTNPDLGKGVRPDVLQPGLYYINPRRFKVDVLEIGLNQVSLLGGKAGAVITKSQLVTQNAAMDDLQNRALEKQREKRQDYYNSQSANNTQRLNSSVSDLVQQAAGLVGASREAKALAGAKRKAPAAPPPAQGTGPQPTLTINEQVSFPSRDGFEISLDMTVEFELLPERIAWLFKSYGDLPAVVEKIILPQILSVSRLKGSVYRAKDFIVGAGREQFQIDLTNTLQKTLAEKQIIVHNALIRNVVVPQQILSPIQQASVAIEQDLTNRERQNTAKKQAQLNTELSLIEQRAQEVAQETEKLRAEIKADQEKEVARLQAETQRQAAEVARQTAEVRAAKTRTLGEAEAKVVALVEGEKAAGFKLKTEAFKQPGEYVKWEFAEKLNPDVKLNVLHAGPGTLWTDLKQASLGDLGGATNLLRTPAR